MPPAMRVQALGVMVVCLMMAQGGPPTKALELPFGPVTRLPSPDGSHVLYGVEYHKGVNEEPALWLEDTHSHQRRKLLEVSDTLSAMWSPDGAAFSVQDHLGSNITESYIYETATLKPFELADVILKSDSSAQRFSSGHAYFDVDRWEGPQTVIVHYYGHTDEPPVVCFDFRYRVSRTGATTKLEQHIFPPDSEGCHG